MAVVELSPSTLAIRLSRWEKVAGFLRDLDVPRDRIRSARAVDDGLAAVRGIRAPGLALPGVAKIGVWRGRGWRSYVVARRGPALVLELDGAKYRTVIVSADGVRQAARELGRPR
jgi:hypothetical protein